ncbi:hypothetical protein [Luteimonas fraxinea]|uniref:hypothetical protein n=1 Tax=Luteimonas fraxinea TaxID=2901869 RepID=UPI001E55D61A|nr:hypothetical protein [Luteimonas fraxinea]MCD9125408.1 hypothetical protein [Luteimonas fraxinea]
MKKWTVVSVMGAAMFASTAYAGEHLSCQLHAAEGSALEGQPKVTEFLWSTANSVADPTGPIATSIGVIDQGKAVGSLALDSAPIQLPPELGGLVYFGQAYDYGNRVALAYLVERAEDSSALPSQVVLMLDKTGRVIASDLIPGDAEPAPGQCRLIN